MIVFLALLFLANVYSPQVGNDAVSQDNEAMERVCNILINQSTKLVEVL